MADHPSEENPQDWQRDRIRATIAKTHLWLGQAQQAAPFEAGLVDSEAGAVASVKAMLLDASDFDRELQALGEALASANFEQVRNALETCARLFERFYQDEAKRLRAEEWIRTAWVKLPAQVRIEVLIELTGFALDHEDHGKALELVEETRGILEGSAWPPEDLLPLKARLAALRYRAGGREQARIEADAIHALYDAERDDIQDFLRAEALRPLAEAYQSMGDTAAALAIYRRVVEEGALNPNARPRAVDLAATCCSMALQGVEPDADLWARMLEIHGGLDHPW
jgi:hypothetical protein